jgi:hypothetical protein
MLMLMLSASCKISGHVGFRGRKVEGRSLVSFEESRERKQARIVTFLACLPTWTSGTPPSTTEYLIFSSHSSNWILKNDKASY